MPERVTRTIIVKAAVSEVYQLWENFENFPEFMGNIKSVSKTGPDTSHWVAAGPLGKTVEWDAATTRLEPNQHIGWNSKDGQGLTTSGQVVFSPLGRGETEITVTLQYVPPAGKAGELVASIFSSPDRMLEEDLRKFKAFAEGMPQRGKP